MKQNKEKTIYTDEAVFKKFDKYYFVFDKENIYIESDNIYKISDEPVYETLIKPIKSKEKIISYKVTYNTETYIFENDELALEFVNIIQLINSGKLLKDNLI